MPKIARKPPNARKRQGRIPYSFQKEQGYINRLILDSASRTARQWISVAWRHPVCDIFLWQSLETKTVFPFIATTTLRDRCYFFPSYLLMWKLRLRKVRTGTKIIQVSWELLGRNRLGYLKNVNSGICKVVTATWLLFIVLFLSILPMLYTL